MTDPNHQVSWLPTRPDLAVKRLRSVGSNCYSETTYEVVSRVELAKIDFEHLDAMGALGIGQSYAVLRHEVIEDQVPPVTTDRRTGAVLADVPPRNGYTGKLVEGTYAYEYHRYEVRRVCDSGD